ncbi:MAG: hypothetical protein AB7O28_10135 [Vicinamibacterales bacterium]
MAAIEAIDRWLAAAEADAERRGLPALKELLRGLAAATATLRQADWNDRAGASGAGGNGTRP